MKIKLEDLRREAYVDAIYAKMENDNVVGVFSEKFDALLISYGFINILSFILFVLLMVYVFNSN